MDSFVPEPRYEGLTFKLLSPVGMVPMYRIAIGLQLINYGLNQPAGGGKGGGSAGSAREEDAPTSADPATRPESTGSGPSRLL